MNFKGTQIALDMYSCNEAVLTNKDDVKNILQQTVKDFNMEEQAIYYYDDPASGDYCYIILCHKGHIHIRVYPSIGFTVADIFAVSGTADSEELAIALRQTFSPDKSKITFLQRGDFGSQYDMKPRRRSQVRTVRRAKNAGYAIKELMLKPKSL